MTTKTDGFRLYRYKTRQSAIEEGKHFASLEDDGLTWTCYTHRIAKPKTRRKPWLVSIFHHGEPLLGVLVAHPVLTIPAGKRAIKRWLADG